MKTKRLFCVLGTLLGLLANGCAGGGSGSGVKTAKISGTVTLDGQPLQQGALSFTPTDGKGASAGATIRDGKYHSVVPLGPKTVSISAAKVVGTEKVYDTPDSPMRDIVQEMVPEIYNNPTTLSHDVKADNSGVNFDLKTPPPAS